MQLHCHTMQTRDLRWPRRSAQQQSTLCHWCLSLAQCQTLLPQSQPQLGPAAHLPRLLQPHLLQQQQVQSHTRAATTTSRCSSQGQQAAAVLAAAPRVSCHPGVLWLSAATACWQAAAAHL